MKNCDSFYNICNDLAVILEKKDKNYGSSYATENPVAPVTQEMGIYVRMGDKINRLKNLLSGEQDSVGESIDDTLADLAGYCVLAIYYRNNKVNK